ncbi:hypothetical protein ACTJJ7_16285 [Phyllobacterium sp. 22229]|uniref:hypothetical protein n=1 Tax=Phyllobacterium sp. 22229 TaxID=3453895 RepID=UPI003F855513
MYEFIEYPKAIYHPETNECVVVNDREAEDAQFEAWGTVEAPKLSVGRGRKASQDTEEPEFEGPQPSVDL